MGRRGHAVICGYSVSARALARVLSGRGFPFVLVDTTPALLTESAVISGVEVVFGDPLHPEALSEAAIEHARILVVTEPYSRHAIRLVGNARAMNPRIATVVGASDLSNRLHPGADSWEVVNSALEGNLQLMRHVLHFYGVPEIDIRAEEARQRLVQSRPG